MGTNWQCVFYLFTLVRFLTHSLTTVSQFFFLPKTETRTWLLKLIGSTEEVNLAQNYITKQDSRRWAAKYDRFPARKKTKDFPESYLKRLYTYSVINYIIYILLMAFLPLILQQTNTQLEIPHETLFGQNFTTGIICEKPSGTFKCEVLLINDTYYPTVWGTQRHMWRKLWNCDVTKWCNYWQKKQKHVYIWVAKTQKRTTMIAERKTKWKQHQ